MKRNSLSVAPSEPLFPLTATSPAELRGILERYEVNPWLGGAPAFIIDVWASMRQLARGAGLDVPPEPNVGKVADCQAAALMGKPIPVDELALRNAVRQAIGWCNWAGGTGAPSPTTKPETVPDGPIAPDKFGWEGREYERLSPVPFRLVSELWQAKGRTRTTEDLAGPIWGDAADMPTADAVRSATRQANRFFEKRGIPFRVHAVTTTFCAGSERQFAVSLKAAG